jgi:hypothetical protein
MTVKIAQEDWENLLPVSLFNIGKTQIEIRPLGWEDLTNLVKRLTGIKDKIKVLNITIENIKAPDSILSIASIVMAYIPDVLSDISGIDIEDLKRLPLQTIVDLLMFILDTNIKSHQGFVKNLNALTSKLAQLMSGVSEI